MNRIRKRAKEKDFWLSVSSLLCAIIGLVLLIILFQSTIAFIISISFCAISIVSVVISLFFNINILYILNPIFLSVSLGEAFHAVLYDFVDYFQGIVMFGNPDNFSKDLTLIILLLLSFLLSLIITFVQKGERNEK